jgi:hypothetical protein
MMTLVIVTIRVLATLNALSIITRPANSHIPNDPVTVIVSILGLCLLDAIFLMVYLLYVEIGASERGFQLRTPIYKSRLYEWSAIQQFHEHWRSSRFSRMYVFVVPTLPLPFWLIGLTQRYGAPIFILHGKLRRFERLIKTARDQRPDLFLEQPVGKG